jgi:broad-specificity NMP kinase
LVTGIAGSGKSTVCRALKERGEEAYSIEEDFEGMFTMYRKGTDDIFEEYDNSPEHIEMAEWRCDVEKLKELMATQRSGRAFYCGVASNMNDLIPLFDAVVVLKASPAVLHKRLSSREGTDDIGNTEASRQAVLNWKEWWEREMSVKGAITISADRNPDEIAEELKKSYEELEKPL